MAGVFEKSPIDVLRIAGSWMDTASDQVDTIGGWREEPQRHTFSPPPKNFFNDTYFLTSYIATQYPGLNASLLSSVHSAIEIWHKDRSADNLPTQTILEATLGRALFVVATVRDEAWKKTKTKDDAPDEKQGHWSAPDGPKQLAKRFGFSVDTLMRRFKEGTIRHRKLSSKSYQIHVDDLPK